MNFNPIQMGADFTSWYMSDVEIKVRQMVNELYLKFRDRDISIEYIDWELNNLGLDYMSLPQSCKDMIDELDIC